MKESKNLLKKLVSDNKQSLSQYSDRKIVQQTSQMAAEYKIDISKNDIHETLKQLGLL